MESKIIESNGLTLEYFIFGKGDVDVLCLHGHGRTAHDFEFLQNSGRRVISLNLFFHGKSTINIDEFEGKYITNKDVHNLLKKLLKAEDISLFHWVGYSQGGRFILTTLPLLSNHIETVSLIAPDGLNDSNFYSWSQRRWWARKLFKRWTKRPGELRTITKALSKVRLISPKIVTFIKNHSADKAKFYIAYVTWAVFRKLRPDAALIGDVVREKNIPFRLIMGKYDKIIPLKSAEHFISKSGIEDSLIIVESGHDFFKPGKTSKFEKLLLIP